MSTSANLPHLSRTAVVLVNLGTPDVPDADGIRRYLKQFLSDPRVVGLPHWLWLPILNLVILKVRPAKLVPKYQLIWGRKDGPIRNITKALANRLQTQLQEDDRNIEVLTAMTYGNPSIGSVLDELERSDFDNLLFVPLFPQYAGATMGAAIDEIDRAMRGRENRWRVTVTTDYHKDVDYITALANSISRSKIFRDGKPRIVFSFHGIPLSQVKKGDPYPQQCHETAALVARALGLADSDWLVSFQSRFGPAEWQQPYTDKILAELATGGTKNVLVICPGFSVDCLETIEEMKIQDRTIFLNSGGESFSYVKALNASWEHVNVIANIVREHIKSLAIGRE